jgi:hypothetical protein
VGYFNFEILVYFCYKLYVTVVKIHCTENKSETFSILIDIVNSINTPRNQYYYWKSPYLKINVSQKYTQTIVIVRFEWDILILRFYLLQDSAFINKTFPYANV